jgi:hypothetical protein
LLCRKDLDRRSGAVQQFDHLVRAITVDLGGGEVLSQIEMQLIEAFAGAAVTLNSLNAKILLGREVSASEHALAISALVRVASRLGLARRARDVSLPDPLQYRVDDGDAA